MTAPIARHLRPKVLHVVDTLGAGGLESNLAVLIAGTVESFAHHVCCVRSSGVVAERLEALEIPVAVIGKRHDTEPATALRIARHCRRIAPHIVHTRNWGTVEGIVGARLARVPIVIHSEHGFSTLEFSWKRRWSVRALSAFVDHMFTVSEDLRRRLGEDFGVPMQRISVVRNGVDAQRFRPHNDAAAMRRSRGYAGTDLIIGVAARLDPIKNHVALVKAFARVAQRCADAHLLIVGEGTERQPIEDEIQRLHLGARVRLVGHRADVETWLAMCDLFAYAPRFEGMPNAVLEAMATGLPVVATRIGGIPEVVIDGVTGRMVEQDNPDALAAAIELYCTDARTRAAHGAAGRAHVIAAFKPEDMLAAYCAVYNGAMAHNGVATPARHPQES